MPLEGPGDFMDPGVLDNPYDFYDWLRQNAPVWKLPASRRVRRELMGVGD